MAQITRPELIERLRKLSKLTTQNGCTEHEANSALTKLMALMAEHGVAQSELHVREDVRGCIQDYFPDLSTKAQPWQYCVTTIAKLFTCRAWLSKGQEDVLDLGFEQEITFVKYFGTPTDVAACIALSSIICIAIRTESDLWSKGKRPNKNAVDSFEMGMVNRLNERLRAMTPPPPISNGKDLVVLKSQLVNAEYAKLGLNLSKSHTRTSNLNAGAYHQGQSAASRVDLGGAKVSGQRLMIGA